jgi:hypothetical protein
MAQSTLASFTTAGGRSMRTTPSAARLALLGGYSTAAPGFRRYYPNPSQVEGGTYAANLAAAALGLWAYYDNSVYEEMARWASYKGTYRLYRQIRALYNPCRRLVDFYATSIYPGALTRDGGPLPDGVPIAIPLAPDTDPALRAAIAQIWRWSNWQAAKSTFVRYAAATGHVLLEIADDPSTGRVFLHPVWPGLLSAIDLDPIGNLRAYVIQYLAYDDYGFQYLYRKEVDAQRIATYRNNQPFAFTENPAAYDNPYGFVPAVWIRHKDLGSNYGAPAIHGSVGKIDELNSLATHVHDQIHKVIGAPSLLASDGGVEQVLGKQQKRLGSSDWADPLDADREGVLIVRAPAGTTVSPLVGDLNLAEATQIMDKLQAEIEADHPELVMYKELRAMSQITGPAASRLMGDVGGLVAESQANYDYGSTMIFAMATAIAGMRAGSGDWGSALSPAQQKFATFGLDDFWDGALFADIMPRPLVPMTDIERLEAMQLRQTLLEETQPGAPPIAVTEAVNVRLGGRS